jgi:hypothetical protein
MDQYSIVPPLYVSLLYPINPRLLDLRGKSL